MDGEEYGALPLNKEMAEALGQHGSWLKGTDSEQQAASHPACVDLSPLFIYFLNFYPTFPQPKYRPKESYRYANINIQIWYIINILLYIINV